MSLTPETQQGARKGKGEPGDGARTALNKGAEGQDEGDEDAPARCKLGLHGAQQGQLRACSPSVSRRRGPKKMRGGVQDTNINVPTCHPQMYESSPHLSPALSTRPSPTRIRGRAPICGHKAGVRACAIFILPPAHRRVAAVQHIEAANDAVLLCVCLPAIWV